jgi:hypothetical protein
MTTVEVFAPHIHVVIAGLDRAIPCVTVVTCSSRYGMDARIESGHDDNWRSAVAVVRDEARA